MSSYPQSRRQSTNHQSEYSSRGKTFYPPVNSSSSYKFERDNRLSSRKLHSSVLSISTASGAGVMWGPLEIALLVVTFINSLIFIILLTTLILSMSRIPACNANINSK